MFMDIKSTRPVRINYQACRYWRHLVESASRLAVPDRSAGERHALPRRSPNQRERSP
jgi:hypothetical protein